MDFIESQQTQYPTLAARYHELGDLFKKKLWHQLTEALKRFVNDPECRNAEDTTVLLYSQFISLFEKELNQLEFALLCVEISRRYRDFPTSSAIFLEARYEAKDRIGTEGSLILRLEMAHLKLCRTPADVKACRTILEESEKEMEGLLEAVDPIVHSNFHRVRVAYYKLLGNANEYYKSALSFLAYTPLDNIGEGERPQLARDLAIAALTSESVWNFGDLLRHPITSVLQGTENQWLHDVLMAFNTGDVPKWQKLCEEHAGILKTQPAFSGNMDFLKKKIRLMALVELVFKRDPHDRLIPFRDIMVQCHVGAGEVELVVMRAMSLCLIKGKLDQIKQTVSVTYVIPRILQLSHLADLKGKMDCWLDKINTAVDFVQNNAGAFRRVVTTEVKG